MTRRLLRDPLPVLAVLIGALLIGLAVLQHRWLSAVSAAERTRMRASAAGRADAFARDVDRELTRAFLMLGVDAAAVERGDDAAYARSFAAWKAKAAYSDLVADVWLVQARPDAGAPLVRRFDPSAGRFLESAVPAEMTALLGRLGARRTPNGPGPLAGLGSTDVTVPAILVPSPQRAPVTDPPEPGDTTSRWRATARPASSACGGGIRPRAARCHAAPAQRVRRPPRVARPWGGHPRAHAHRAWTGHGQGARPEAGGGRLPDQAVRQRGAAGPHRGAAALAPGPGGGGGPRPRTRASGRARPHHRRPGGGGARGPGAPSTSPRASSTSCATSWTTAERPSRGPSCCSTSGATRPTSPPEPSMCTWPGSGASVLHFLERAQRALTHQVATAAS